ncbi:transcriptional regulator/sugar kinase (plasmid) [Deinococcus peraridilitoris DSM 19664]|uniref:Transcriptional regulator/sugar kinase n=2 Tax=Deinococcus TaxID=1298 RepID=L0A7F0_DEIPD|nr:transcriptional regulator/sugar kinase [Deinococcus peraridilitoris DSM 19664]
MTSDPPFRFALTLDVGGSHITAAVVDLTSRALLPATLTRRSIDEQANREAIISGLAHAALDAARVEPYAVIAGIGMAMPAPFDYVAGVSLMQHKFHALYERNILHDLQEAWVGTPLAGMPVRIANDADLFALGEWWAGAARGCSSVIGLTLGTGMGSGFIRDGRIVTEGDGVPAQGELWSLPYLNGLAEEYANGQAVTRAYHVRTGATLTPKEISERAAYDDAARDAFTELGEHLMHILLPVVKCFAPDCLVVGGNVARSWALFGHLLQGGLNPVRCVQSMNFEEAALLGAAILSTESSAS